MAVFSTNQVRQLYVVTKHATPNIASTDGVGALAVKNDTLALIVALVVAFFSAKSMSNRAAYWMNRSEAAESVIGKMWKDNSSYMLDVMTETDVYSNWEEYK